MQSTTRTGLILIASALVLGIAGDLLLNTPTWGVNVGLYALVIVVVAVAAGRLGGIALTGGGRWLAIPAVIFASAFAWRDSPMLLACNLLLVLILLALYADRARSGRLRLAGLVDYALAVIVSGVYALLGAFTVASGDIKWHDLKGNRLASPALRIGAGILIAAPLLLVFGSLFASADANFADLVRRLFNWNINELIGHLCIAAMLAWIGAGFLHQVLMARPLRIDALNLGVDRPTLQLGIVETATALGLLNALFLAFVVLQFRYLFGSASALGYAEYARRGFFELVAVAVLVLPVLLGAHWLLRKDNSAHVRLFNVLAGALIALLFVIMLSALQRMALYVNQYGLTEMRLYTTAFMLWLALVFAWFWLTVLRGRREQFAFGGLATALVVALAVNLLNPDYFIARINVDRAAQAAAGESPSRSRPALDASYLSILCADALPVLLMALPNVPDAQQRCHAAQAILTRWSPPAPVDWRAWNPSRAQAWEMVQAWGDYLRATACPPDPNRD